MRKFIEHIIVASDEMTENRTWHKGRLLVNATFDGVPYRGQVVKMGTPCYIIGVTKQIRKQINKTFGDTVEVTLKERE